MKKTDIDFTILSKAMVNYDRVKITEFAAKIINAGPDSVSARQFNFTPLMYACASGDLIQIQIEIKKNDADIWLRDSIGNTPMHWAILGGHPNIIHLLKQRYDVSLCVFNHLGIMLPQLAIILEDENAITVLRNIGVDFNLSASCFSANYQPPKSGLLSQISAWISSSTHVQQDPILRKWGFLSHKDVFQTTSHAATITPYETALTIAKRKKEEIEKIKRRNRCCNMFQWGLGTLVDVPDYTFDSIIVLIAEKVAVSNDASHLRSLAYQGNTMSTASTLLLSTVKSGHVQGVRGLVLNTKHSKKMEQDALELALKYDHFEIAKFFNFERGLKAGDYVNKQKLLHRKIRQNQLHWVVLLSDLGASFMVKDHSGAKPLDYAKYEILFWFRYVEQRVDPMLKDVKFTISTNCLPEIVPTLMDMPNFLLSGAGFLTVFRKVFNTLSGSTKDYDIYHELGEFMIYTAIASDDIVLFEGMINSYTSLHGEMNFAPGLIAFCHRQRLDKYVNILESFCIKNENGLSHNLLKNKSNNTFALSNQKMNFTQLESHLVRLTRKTQECLLDLSGNSLNCPDATISQRYQSCFTTLVRRPSMISTLDLSRNNLRQEDVEMLFRALLSSSTLRELNLSENDIVLNSHFALETRNILSGCRSHLSHLKVDLSGNYARKQDVLTEYNSECLPNFFSKPKILSTVLPLGRKPFISSRVWAVYYVSKSRSTLNTNDHAAMYVEGMHSNGLRFTYKFELMLDGAKTTCTNQYAENKFKKSKEESTIACYTCGGVTISMKFKSSCDLAQKTEYVNSVCWLRRAAQIEFMIDYFHEIGQKLNEYNIKFSTIGHGSSINCAKFLQILAKAANIDIGLNAVNHPSSAYDNTRIYKFNAFL